MLSIGGEGSVVTVTIGRMTVVVDADEGVDVVFDIIEINISVVGNYSPLR
ncbi:hypothetical protein [Thiolapillus sp.]|nr:hypothetical protein [Thiolapillus sp.]